MTIRNSFALLGLLLAGSFSNATADQARADQASADQTSADQTSGGAALNPRFMQSPDPLPAAPPSIGRPVVTGIAVPSTSRQPAAIYRTENADTIPTDLDYERPTPKPGRKPGSRGFGYGPLPGNYGPTTVPWQPKMWGSVGPLFDTISLLDDISNTSGFLFIPADPHGAAGPNHVVSVANVSLQIHSKSGTELYNDDLQAFFAGMGASAPTTFTFDPKVLYDSQAGRWLVVTLERTDTFDGDPANTSYIFLAVSDDSDPTGVWYQTRINVAEVSPTTGLNSWLDYPGFAFDEEAVYITGNLFSFGAAGSYGGTRVKIIAKGIGTGGFYDGGTVVANSFNTFTGSGAQSTQMPARIEGTPPAGSIGTWLVLYSGLQSGGIERVQVTRINTPLGTPTFTMAQTSLGNFDSNGTMPDAPQSGTDAGGTSRTLETNDKRALDAVWRGNSLWTVFTHTPAAGADVGQATARYQRLTTDAAGAVTAFEGGNAGGEDIAAGTHTFFPSLSVNSYGQMVMGFTASGSTIFPSVYAVSRRSSDAAGTLSASRLIKAGVAHYYRAFGGSQNRWGDYTATALDPADQCFWVYNKWADTKGTILGSLPNEDGRWNSSMGRVCVCDGDETTVDTDLDGICANLDNCDAVSNRDQVDFDVDTVGDACDNCTLIANAAQTNSDADTFGDACDNCPLVSNQSQADSDSDGIGDACDVAAPSTTGLVSAPDASVFGQSVALTATVAGGSGTPTGSVTFLDGASALGTAALNGSGIAATSTAALSVGVHNLTANYAGSATYAASSGVDTHTVNKADTALSISDSPDPSTQGSNVTITASLTVVAPGAGTPTGTIAVTASNSAGCNIVLPLTDCNLTFSASGSQTINASYSGDGNFNGVGATAIANLSNASNTPPTISAISDQVISEDGNTGALAFTVGDTQTPAASLTLSAASDNTTLVPVANIVFGGSGASRTVTVTPAANQSGVANVTVTVTDASSATATESFQVTVNAQNDLPTISAISDLAINEDGNTGALAFTIADVETAAASLTLSAASDNTALVPVANVVFGGSGASRTVTVTPAANQSGVANLTITVTDANTGTASEPFQLTVNAQNDLPTISAIADLAINEDSNTGALAFTVGDVETAAASLTLSAASSNTTLVPVANVVFGGSGASRTVTVTPSANQSGVANVTVTVTDANTGTAVEAFQLTVNAQNDLPTISAIADLAINEDGNTGALAFTVGDVETAAGSLTLSAASSNTTLVPVANIVFGGSGASRTVTVTPAANQSGVANLTITVTDANTGTAVEAFQLTVNAQNDLPTISAIADLAISEDSNTGALAFTIADVETAAASLTLSAASDNTALVPVANVVFGGSGASRTVTVTPTANQSGVANVTVTVTDANTGTAVEAFQLTVNAQNDLPTISAISDLVINEDGNTGALAFTVGDVETAAGSLTLSAASSNTTLVPVANVVFGGAGASRTVTVTPAANQSGVANLTITVTDANTGTAVEAFQLTVNAQNDLPTVGTPGNQTINEDTATSVLNVSVADIETAAASLVLTASSNNTALVPNANIVLAGAGTTRTVQVMPLANASGTATITLTITDAGSATGTATFDVVVNAVNDAPGFTVAGDQSPIAGSSGAQTVPGFVTGVDFGPNEAAQAVAEYIVTEVSDPAGIVSAAALSNSGTLSYTLNGSGGTAVLGVVLRDNGGTANGGIDTSAQLQFSIVVIATADLSVTKTNLGSALVENGNTRYTIEVRHGGFDAAPGSSLTDAVPAGLSGFSWTCSGSGGAVCPALSGSGALAEVFDMPIGGVLTYVVDATVIANVGDTVANTASVTTGTVQELNAADNTAIDSDPVTLDLLFRSGFE